jgi:hypothetical protein
MLRVTCLVVVGFALLPLLTACESGSYGYGYANESQRTVTVVEHSRHGVDRSTFTPQAKQLPVEGGSVADRVEVLDAQRRKIAAFTREDYERSHHPGSRACRHTERSYPRVARVLGKDGARMGGRIAIGPDLIQRRRRIVYREGYYHARAQREG